MDKSTELNGTDAAEYIDTLLTADEVRAFVEGDTRKGVLAAAEKKIAALTDDSSTESSETAPTTPETETEKRIADQKTWMYHKEHEPRIFEKGEEIPKGWQKSRKGIVPDIWDHDRFGKWSRKA